METEYASDDLAVLGMQDEEVADITFYKGTGCDSCEDTGYKGRAGLYEVMALTPALRRLILQGASTADLQDQAVEDGMLTLRMDGIMKLRKGVTTLEEIVKDTAG